MGLWSGVGEVGHWIFDVFKAPVVGSKYAVQSLASCPAYAVGITDGSRCFYNYDRLAKQIWNTSRSVILSKGKTNPIAKITEIVLNESKKNNPSKYAKTVAKFLFKRKLKRVTVNVVVKDISGYLIEYIAAKYFAGKAVSGVISGGATLGVGAVLTATSIGNESYNSSMRLKHRNHIVYSKLFSKNLECFLVFG